MCTIASIRNTTEETLMNHHKHWQKSPHCGSIMQIQFLKTRWPRSHKIHTRYDIFISIDNFIPLSINHIWLFCFGNTNVFIHHVFCVLSISGGVQNGTDPRGHSLFARPPWWLLLIPRGLFFCEILFPLPIKQVPTWSGVFGQDVKCSHLGICMSLH